MSTYTEQDCLDRIAQMKTWREDAGDALEEKDAIADASNTKLADMPALITAADPNPPYAVPEFNFYSASGSNPTVSINVKSNTTWHYNAVNMGTSGGGVSGTGSGNQTLNIACSTTQPYGSRFYRVYIECDGTTERTFAWVQRYATSS